jgi:hypothetical protein
MLRKKAALAMNNSSLASENMSDKGNIVQGLTGGFTNRQTRVKL